MPKQKRDDKSPHMRDWTTRKLWREYRQLDAYIKDGCFGASDVRMLQALDIELSNRGQE